MTGLGITGDIVAILVLLLVIGMTWLLLRRRVGQSASTLQRKRADKGKVKCYHIERSVWSPDEEACKNKAGWVTPSGYFCDDHWEVHSRVTLTSGAESRARWAHQLVWRQKGTDVWTT